MGQKDKSKITNTFERGMYLDSLHSLQPQGTYRDAWAVTNKSDQENKYGVSNAAANELFVKLPKGTIRSLLYVEERNYYIAFLNTSGVSEIGIIYEDTKEYKKVVDDGDLPEPLNFSDKEWNSLTAKVMQPCNQLYIYWSNGDYYYRLNIDDPCKEWKERPLKLFREHCIAQAQVTVMSGGELPNGIYQPFIRLRDADGNTTNWFHIGMPAPVGQGRDGDNIAGENSEKSIAIKVEDLHEDFGIVDIGIYSVIGGRSATVWVDTVAYGKGMIDYHYRGTTGKEIPINLAEVLERNDLYIRGENLVQFDGHLVLYNLRSNNNIDWQRDVNNIKWYYQIYGVRRSEAHKYKGLRPNENYWFGIHGNYTDGTKTTDFAGIGRDGSNARMVRLPGCDCEVPYWEVEDTTKRTEVFCDIANFISKPAKTHTLTEHTSNDIVPDYVLNGSGDVEVENHTDYASSDEFIDETNKDVNDATEGSAAKSFDKLACICENFKKVLEDAVTIAGNEEAQSMRFDALNHKEMYELACDCDALTTPGGQRVYPPFLFVGLVADTIK